MTGTLSTKIAGRFRMTVYRPDGTPRIETPWIDNIVTDTGLERIGTGSWFTACHVGSGSNAPAVTDAQLQTYVAGTTTVQAGSSGAASTSPYYGYRILTFRFGTGAAAGNLSEVGIATAAASGGSTILITRALIKDVYGDPTTITVLSDEVLDVTYEFRLYPSTEGDITGTIDISGVTYNYTIRASSVTTGSVWGEEIGTVASFSPTSGSDTSVYNGSIGLITGSPSGTSYSFDLTNQTYGANNLYRDGGVTFGLTQGNLSGGIRSLRSRTTLGGWQIDFGDSIPKDATKTLTLFFRISWNRV